MSEAISLEPLKSEFKRLPVFIVDDDELVRTALQGMLEDAGIDVETYPSAEAFLADFRPDRKGCVLVDVDLPGMNGYELVRKIKATSDQPTTIMITGHTNIRAAVEAMKSGASDFLEKPVVSGELLSAIARVLEDVKESRKSSPKNKAATDQIASLTMRQRQILDLIVAGQANKTIAATVGISQRTVETHRAAIMKKTGAKSLAALVRLVFAADGVSQVSTNQGAANQVPANSDQPQQVEAIIATVGLVGAPESEQFKRFFDQIPLAIVVAEMKKPELIVYANPEFEKLTGQSALDLIGQPWSILKSPQTDPKGDLTLGLAIAGQSDFVGTFRIVRSETDEVAVDAYSNLIEDDEGVSTFRLAALVDDGARNSAENQNLEKQILEKDALLLEFQHRVKNNLQMITALIRVEARSARGQLGAVPFDRLAGRVDSLQLLYKLLSDSGKGAEIDLGVYLSEVASTVMHSHAVEGIRLNLKIDAYPVSVNVAMPTGLVVNELLTNALKHAFVGRDGGTITLHSLVNEDGCKVVVADDGVGLPEGVEWPKQGKLSALIVRSLRQNAKAELTIESSAAKGTKVTIVFTRAASAPDSNVARKLG